MGNLFGRPRSNTASDKPSSNSNNPPKRENKNNKVTDKDRAILDLKNARDRLKKYRKKIDSDTVKLTEQAKELIRKQQRDRALLVLKLKKHKEKEVTDIDNQLLSVVSMIDTVEWESVNMEVMRALKSGNEALNKLHEEMSVDDVVALLEETNEAIEVENQINSLLAGQVENYTSEDLEEELRVLMGEKPTETKTANKETTASKTYDLPDAPQGTTVNKEQKTTTAKEENTRVAVSA